MAVNELTLSHHSPPMPPLRKHPPHCFSGANNNNSSSSSSLGGLRYNTATNKVLDGIPSPLPKVNHFSTKDPSRVDINSNPLFTPKLPSSQMAGSSSVHNLKSSVIKNDCSTRSYSPSFKEVRSGFCLDELPKRAQSPAQGKLTLNDNFTTPSSLLMLNKNTSLNDIDVPTENFIREMQRPEVLELVRKYNPYPSSHLNYNRDPSLWKNLTQEEHKEKVVYNQRVETHCQRLMSDDKLSPATAYVLGNIITQLELQAKICEGSDASEVVDSTPSYAGLPFAINHNNDRYYNETNTLEPPLKESKHRRSESIIVNNYSKTQSANQRKIERCQTAGPKSSGQVKGWTSNKSRDPLVEASELGAQLWRSQMEHKRRQSPHGSANSDHPSRLDPQAYQSYAAGILHSSKRSDRFLRLQNCFTILNRIAKIEKQYNITGEVLKKSGYSNVPQRVRQVLRQLYTELDEAQSKNEFFFSSKKSKRWNPENEYELRRQQKSLKDRCAIYDLRQKSLNGSDKKKSATLCDIKRELSFDEVFAKYQDLDREFIRSKMSHAYSLPNLDQENRKSTPPPGSYLRIQETCNKLSKMRAIHGTHIDDLNSLYEIHVKQHSPNDSLDTPPLHIRSESAPYRNADGKQSPGLQRSDSFKESFFNFSNEEYLKNTSSKAGMAAEDHFVSPQRIIVPLPPPPPPKTPHSVEKRSEPPIDKNEVKEELVIKSVQDKSKAIQGSPFMKSQLKKPPEDKVDTFYNPNDRCSSSTPELKESRFRNLSSSSDSSGNLSNPLYSRSYKPSMNTSSITRNVSPKPYRAPSGSFEEEPVATKPVFQVRDVKSFVTKDNEFAQGPYFETSKSRTPSPSSSSLSSTHRPESAKLFPDQNTGTKELADSFPPLNGKNTISLIDISKGSLETSQLSKSSSMPFIASSPSSFEDVNNNNENKNNNRKRSVNRTHSKTIDRKDLTPSRTSSSDADSDFSRSHHSFQARVEPECESYKPPKEILNDMLHVVEGYNVLVDEDHYIKRVEKEMAIKYLDNLGQEWKKSQRNNLRGQDLVTSDKFAKLHGKDVKLREPYKVKNTTPSFKEKCSKEQVPSLPPPPPPPPPPPKPKKSPRPPPLPKSLPANLGHMSPSPYDHKPLDCSTPTIPTHSAVPYHHPGTVRTSVPGQVVGSIGSLPNASSPGYMVRSQNAVEDGPWEMMNSRMTPATPNGGLETTTNTHRPPATITGD